MNEIKRLSTNIIIDTRVLPKDFISESELKAGLVKTLCVDLIQNVEDMPLDFVKNSVKLGNENIPKYELHMYLISSKELERLVNIEKQYNYEKVKNKLYK